MAPLRSRKWVGSCNMAADEKQVSALMKRHEQVKRWEDSDTNTEILFGKRDKSTVQFQDGCVFLAACSSGDKEEVEKLLRSERSADINTANVDGLTALHQACIDDNLEMVEFLVEHGADIDVCDNEGWTPLHATASCAFLEIARYLINHKANVAAVNNDGDLPIDIAENEDMDNLLMEEMNKQGIDAEAARCEEEQRMLEDANLWLSDKTVKEVQHPKTGATALHVAAAKGYIKVLKLLLEAGVDINAEDCDGWTPLHAAAHWGQEEACKILVENLCDMSYKNKAGHTAFDLAENEMLDLLEDLKEKQASIRSEQEKGQDIILSSAHGGKRRSSVTRMSGDQKHNVLHRNSEEERTALSSTHPGKTDYKDSLKMTHKVADGKPADELLTEYRSDKGKQVPQQPQLTVTVTASPSTPASWSWMTIADIPSPIVELRRPASVATPTAGVELRRSSSVATPTPSVDTPRPASVATPTAGVELRRSSSVATPTPSVDTPRPASVATPTAGVELRRSSSVATPTPSVDTPRPASVATPTAGVELRRSSSVATPTPSVDTPRPASVATSTPGVELQQSARVPTPSTVVKVRYPESPKTDPVSETVRPAASSVISTTTATVIAPILPSASTTIVLPQPDLTTDTGTTAAPSTRTPLSVSKVDKLSDLNGTSVQESKKATNPVSSSRDLVSRFISVPTRLPTEQLQERLAQGRVSSPGTTTPATTTTASTTKTTTDADVKAADRNSSTFGQSYGGFRSSFTSRSNNYVPYYLQRQQREAQASGLTNSDGTPASHEPVNSHNSFSVSGTTTLASSSPPAPSPVSVTTTTTITTTNSVFKRSYEPPKRDEETETQRKARAKHARQTRRSTQGVSLEDIEKAEESLSRDKVGSGTSTTSSYTSSSQTAAATKVTTSSGSGEINSTAGIPTASIAGIPTASIAVIPTVNISGIPTASTTNTVSSTARSTDPDLREDRSVISGYRRWAPEDRTDSLMLSYDCGLKRCLFVKSTDTVSTRGSYRRARVENSSTGVADITTSYIPRSQRLSALLPTDNVISAPSSQPSPMHTSRLSDQALPREQQDPKKDESVSTQDKKEEKKEPSSLRARRQRRERRSTGIGLDSEDGEAAPDGKSQEDTHDDNLGSSRHGRDNINSDTLSSTEISKPTGYSDIDYKKKYEEEKTANERLRKELEVTKKGLVEAKTELDRAARQKDNSRHADRDKRILEKKLADMEEELKKIESLKSDNQRLKDENGALIRVISKLSK